MFVLKSKVISVLATQLATLSILSDDGNELYIEEHKMVRNLARKLEVLDKVDSRAKEIESKARGRKKTYEVD